MNFSKFRKDLFPLTKMNFCSLSLSLKNGDKFPEYFFHNKLTNLEKFFSFYQIDQINCKQNS